MNPLDLKNDIVIFDIDGVLAKYDFGDLGRKIIPEHEWVVRNMQKDMYKFIQRTHLFDELIHEKNSNDMYILSTAFCSFEQNNKIEFLDREYEKFREDNIYFVARDEYKVDILKELREIYDKEGKLYRRIVLIEDSVQIMASVEALRNDRIRCFLVSDFI